MHPVLTHLRVRPRMSLAVVTGIAAGVVVPSSKLITSMLIGWNVGVWIYLALMAWMMLRADHGHLRRTAVAHTQGAAVVLGLVVGASLASLAAIVVELAGVRHGLGQPLALAHLVLAVVTVVGAGLLLPVVFPPS